MKQLSNYVDVLNFIEMEIDGTCITTSEPRVKVAATLLSITIDHAQGIRLLLEQGAFPSASALMRCLFETYIRAMWVWKCANEKQLLKFVKDDKIIDEKNKTIPFKTLVEAIEMANCFPEYLSEIQKNVWAGLNSLTHGGSILLHRSFDGKTIQHRYDNELVKEIIEFSTMLVCMAFAGLIELCEHPNSSTVAEKLFEIVAPIYSIESVSSVEQ
ncbi:DUF6988 family protein [Aeromonas veronii]